MVKILSKEFGNWRSLIIVYVKQSWIFSFYANVTKIMLYQIFLIFVWQLIVILNIHLPTAFVN